VSVVAPGAEGYLGVLAHHAPLVAALGVGALTVRREDDKQVQIAVHRGVLEVSGNAAMVLADTAELASEIDEERARRALQRARLRLEARAADTDLERAGLALARALNRVKVKQR